MRERRPHTIVVSKTGRITLPKAIRDAHGWTAGTRLALAETPDGVVLTKAPAFSPTRFEDVFGCLAWEGPARTIDEMDAAVLEEARRGHEP
jgi:AbrB family looped-hinge helix DNA binding protein